MIPMTTLLLAAALAASPHPSACGWFGFDLAPPDVAVQGADVKLASPLRIVRVERGSPAAAAGMRAGMEILAIDGERWDAAGFLPNVVRLQTAAAEDDPRFALRLEGIESEARVKAAPCGPEQLQERARLLSTLGRMEGTSWSRFRPSPEGDLPGSAPLPGEPGPGPSGLAGDELEALDRAMEEAGHAVREAEERMNDPEIRRRIEAGMREAERRLGDPEVRRQLEDAAREADRLSDPEVHRRIEAAMREAERRLGDPEIRRRVEEAMREVEEAQGRHVERMNDPAFRRDLERMARDAAGAAREAGDGDLGQGMQESMRELERSLEELNAAAPGAAGMEEARRGLEAALEELQQEQAALVDIQRFHAQRVEEEVSRALEEAQLGREERRRALLEAVRATERVGAAASTLEGAEFDLVEEGKPGADGPDHGLRVVALSAGAPLARAGVRPGDVIVSAGGSPVTEAGDLVEAIAERIEAMEGEPRGGVELEVRRGASTRSLTLPLPGLGRHGPI